MAGHPRGRLPNFLFIGADKAGSTWLAETLRQHPNCFVPAAKDVYFFDRYYERGLDWYARLFTAAPPEARAVGEISHDYLYSAAAAERIARDLPSVRLIVFLRDPAERCFSEYLYHVRSGLTRRPFREALADFPEMLDHSRYAGHLRRYIQLFDRESVGIFFFEDLQTEPVRLAESVFAFLDLECLSQIDVSSNPLPAARPRSVLGARIARESAQIFRRFGAPGIVGRVKRSRWTRVLYVPYGVSERPKLSLEDRDYISRELAADITELREILGVGAPAWSLAHGGVTG